VTALLPFHGELCFTHADRNVIITRASDTWIIDGRGAANDEIARAIVFELRALNSPQTRIDFVGTHGVVGRLRDGAGARDSWCIDYDAPGHCFGTVQRTMEEALCHLLYDLADEEAPDSSP
jgi:hypothetical protein